MLNEFFKNIVNFLTAVNIDGETNINNSLTVLSSLEVQPNNSHTTLYVTNSTVGINTQFPNVEFTVNGSISSNFVIYDGLGNSGNWNSTSTLVKDKSANWDSVYSTYNKNSSDYTKYNYVNNSFLPLSGGIVTGITQFNNNVTIWGVLSATGGTYFSNTIYSTTSAISVIHVGAGPALFVGSIGTGDIASFYDLDQNVEMLHIGGHDGDYPNVGIKTSYPNKDFTVNGEISASRIIWTPNGNSDLWNTTYNNQTNYLPLSGGTMTGKLVATANLTASKLNIGNAIGTPSPTTVSDGDVWISNQNKFAWKSNGNAIYAAGLSQSNTFNNTQIIGASTPLTLLTVGNTGGGSAAVFTAQGPNNVVRITQTGSGNALVVEDEANPDSNPFVINNMGSVGIGLSSLSGIDAKLTVIGNVSATGSYFGDGSKLTGIVAGDTVATTLVRNNSANWDSVYSTYNKNSATYATIEFSNNKFLPLSGGTITGDLIVDNTLQVGDGPNFDFIITEEGNVGINTETPNEKLTVVGNISCTGFLYGDGSKLTGIVAGDTVATTLVRNNSANWDSVYTTVTLNSAINWNYQGTDLKQLSANWELAYNTRNLYLPLSGGIITGNLEVGEGNPVILFIGDEVVGVNTEQPNEALTVVGNISATGNIYTNGKIISGGIDISSLFNSGGGGTGIDTGVRSLTANWENTYTTVQSNSSSWNPILNSGYLSLSGGTLSGKLTVATTITSSKLNIGNAIPIFAPATTVDGDVWITNQSKLAWRANGHLIVASSVSQINTFTQPQVIQSSNNTSAALRITQTGLGNALLVDDDTHPDSTPFVIDNIGSVGIGLSSLSGIDAKLTVIGNVSATGSYFGDGSKLTGIVAGDTVATTLVRNNSANWDSVYTSVKNTSGNWDSLYTNVNVNSAIWGSQTNNATLSGLILNNLDTYQIGFAGDSIAQAYGTVDFSSSPFAWYCFYLNPKSKRILWDPRLAYNNVSPFNTLNPSGGYNFARGGEATQDLTRQLNLIQQRVPDILVLQIGTNNGFGTLADCDTRFSETTAFLVGVFNTGVKHCIVFPVPPKSTTNSATVVRLTNEYNKRLENYCKTNIKKMSFFDNYEFLVNPASEFYRPLGVFNGSSQTSVTVDGTHPSTFGSFRVANKVEDTLLKDLPTIKFKATNPGDAWDATNNIRGNLFGRNGIMFSESGTAGLSTGWTLTNGTGLIATPTRVLSQAYSGYTMQKLTFSGTPTSNTDQVRLAYTATNNSFFNRGFTNHYFELVFRPISFNNLHLPGVQIQILGGAGTSDTYSIGGGGGSGGLVAKLCPVQDGYFHVYSTRPLISNNTNNQFQIFVNINGLNGIPASGELEVGFVGLWGVS